MKKASQPWGSFPHSLLSTSKIGGILPLRLRSRPAGPSEHQEAATALGTPTPEAPPRASRPGNPKPQASPALSQIETPSAWRSQAENPRFPLTVGLLAEGTYRRSFPIYCFWLGCRHGILFPLSPWRRPGNPLRSPGAGPARRRGLGRSPRRGAQSGRCAATAARAPPGALRPLWTALSRRGEMTNDANRGFWIITRNSVTMGSKINVSLIDSAPCVAGNPADCSLCGLCCILLRGTCQHLAEEKHTCVYRPIP